MGQCRASLSLLDADSFWTAGNVPLATFSQVTCAEFAPVVPLWAPCDLVPWCLTFPEKMRVGAGGTSIP